MAFLKTAIWTLSAVGLGIFLATAEVDGRTPLEHMERTWKRTVNPSQVDWLKDGLEDALDDAKDAVSSSKSKHPRERISPADREALNRVIAQKK